MKREDIKKLMPDISDEILDKIMAENGRDVEAAKAKFSDYETIKTQLTEANKTIEGFKAMDIDGIKKAADDWKTKYEQSEKDAAAKIADMQFDGLLTSTVSAVKGKNAKAIRALLDIDALKVSKNQETDIKSAVEALKKDCGYLFEAEQQLPPPGAPGAGSSQVTQTPDAMAAQMRSVMGLPPINNTK